MDTTYTRAATAPPTHELNHDHLRRIVEFARLAPSVHNTQPWWWQASGTTLELWADRTRSLPAADPAGRNLVISCGAALHYTLVAAEAVGAKATHTELPDGPDSDLMARLQLEADHPTADAVARVALLTGRHTDRRRFTSWPVPEESLERLAEAGRTYGAAVLPLTDPAVRARVEDLAEDARRRQQGDPDIVEETESWIDHGSVDGVPTAVLPPLHGVRGERATRFGPDLAPDTDERPIHGTDGLLVISTPDDGTLSWLRAGASLSALWLRATGAGLSLVPLSQLTEVQRTRTALEQLMPPPDRVPQLLARVGWQEIGRPELPRTPRRPVEEVLGFGSRPVLE
jgi:hypothetical protein